MRPIAWLLALVLAAVAGPRKAVSPLGAASHFESNPEARATVVEGNPLRYAAERIGLDLATFELPRAFEAGYRTVCRFPLIDAVLNRPLYLKEWAESTSARLRQGHMAEGVAMVHEPLAALRGTRLWEPSTAAPDPEVAAELRQWVNGQPFTPSYKRALTALIEAHLQATALARHGVAELEREAPDELAWLRANPGYYLAPDGKTMPELTGSTATHLEFLERVRRLDLPAFLLAGEILAGAVHAYADATTGWGIEQILVEPKRANDRFTKSTTYGRVLIAGFGVDRHKEDADLLVDLGGDDFYTNSAGAGRAGAGLCIDHGGDDAYYAPDGRYVQGFGFLGCGFLVDLDGNDRYTARHFSQGAGICGVGVLWDRNGDDIYDAHAFCQGAGMFGVGALLDSAGADLYDCATLGQGSATTLGVGVLDDLEGDDRYHLAIDPDKDTLGRKPGHGQGGALSFRNYPWRGKLTPYGGIGLLCDHDGNDRYRSRGWCDQGGSYLLSIGALVDDAGNDHYTAGTGQGSGIHVTGAILVDRAGHDIYEGGFRCGGSGGDRSPGFLIDYQGDDVYHSKSSSFASACKPFAFSLMIDYAGDDRYLAAGPHGKIEFNNFDSFGSVWPESTPWNWMYAICLDLGGDDEYAVRNHANNSERHSFGHGLHLDTTWEGGDLIGTVPSPLQRRDGVDWSALPEALQPLGNPDPLVRLRVAPRVGEADLESLVDLLVESRHRGVVRDGMEILHAGLSSGRLGEEARRHYPRLLRAADEELRAIAADDCGIWGIAAAEEALHFAALRDKFERVRAMAVRALRETKAPSGPFLARALAAADPAAAVRRQAIWTLEEGEPEPETVSLLRKVLRSDSDLGVRAVAADALGRLRAAAALDDLIDASKLPDIYLQRAAGRALAELGHIEGVELLIETLSFPSIDAFENYGRNIPNSIAVYCGHDFPEGRRYSRDRWNRWVQRHRDTIDVAANVTAHRAYQALGELTERSLPEFEDFLASNPGHPRAARDVARTLNEWAWKMVTAPPKAKQSNVKKGLRYAQRAVEIDPDPNYFDTLAEAYFAAGDLKESERICNEMLRKRPGESMFLDRLKRIAQLRKANAPPPKPKPKPAPKPQPPKPKPPAPPPKK